MSDEKPSKNNRKRNPAKGKAAAARKARNQRRAMIAIGVVVVAGVVLVLFALSGTKGSKPPSGGTTASTVSATVMNAVAGVPPATLQAVGAGSTSNPPKPLPASAAALTSNGLPEMLYIGAEYCPYCAAERWAMVQALSRFGTFTGLKETTSSSTDVYANTPTFAFYGSTYKSQYLVFTPVETQDRSGGQLQKPTDAQQQILQTYDAPPYAPSGSSGSIPFTYIAGHWVTVGATFSPAAIQNLTMEQIATSLSRPSAPSAQGVDGAANMITAAICTVTKNQPSSVCSPSWMQALESQLAG